jgi:transposase
MPFERKRSELKLEQDVKDTLISISRSQTESVRRVNRAHMILDYAEGESVSAIARKQNTHRPKIERCIDKALQFGALAALDDIMRKGRPPAITLEAKTWLISLACRKPKDLGYPNELWTTALLSKHARMHCEQAGHPSLSKISRGTVSKILSKSKIKPHKIKYFIERRDPEFERKMVQILYVYKQVEVLIDQATDSKVAYLSYDEKPGIQGLGNVRPDQTPVPGKQSCVGRDHEYRRYGTVTLMAGIDLLNGWIHSRIVDRHFSREFIGFLKLLDLYYKPETTIRIILDNHAIHTSKETRRYLKTMPNRFEFVFTPKHGSWLNLIETFFAKMAKSMLRGIRVDSLDELKLRLQTYVNDLNEEPTVFRWKYQLESENVV